MAAMDAISRDHRISELRALLLCNPRGLIELYCKTTGAPTGNQLPHVSFTRMIDAIVAHEEEGEKSLPPDNSSAKRCLGGPRCA
jgi:hypothetical protein